MQIRRLVNMLFVIGCTIGCAIQSLYVTVEYLSYKVRPDTRLFHDPTTPSPAVSICFGWPPILNHSEMTRLFGKIHGNYPNNLTLNQLFHLTPKANEVLLKCNVNMPNKVVMGAFQYSKDSCNELFEINRYFQQEDMCYTFRLREQLVYNVQRVTQEGKWTLI